MAAVDAVSLALEVTRILKQYAESVATVDDTILDCQLQVDGLTQVLRSLSAVLQTHELDNVHAPGSESLRESIPTLIDSCHGTLQKTAHAVDVLRTSGKDNAFKRSWRGMKLMATHRELEGLLTYLKAHSINLQMAITTANLMISIHSPKALASEQNMHFDRLEHMLSEISDKMSKDADAKPSKPAPPAYPKTLEIDDSTKALTVCAMQAMSSASTVRGLSVSGKTLIDGDEPAFEFVNGKVEKPAVALYQESTTGSEYGDPLNEAKSSEVFDWIPESNEALARPVSVRQESANTTHSQSSLGSMLASITGGWTRISSAPTSADPASLFNKEDDEDEEFEIAQKKFARANDQLACNNLRSASKLFQEGFEFANGLNEKSQEKLDLAGMKLKHATNCAPVLELAVREAALLEIMQIPPTSAARLEQSLAATHELARLRLEQSQLNGAEDCCRQALKGRRQARSIGKEHADYYASLKLLVDILSAKEEYTAARQYAELLPPELKGDLERRLAILATTQASQPSETLPSLPPRPIRGHSPLRYPAMEAYTAR